MTTTAHAPVVCELHADTINWELPPAPVEASRSMSSADILAEAVVDALSYRLIVLESLDALHTLTRGFDRERVQHTETKNEYRAFRERVMREASAV